MENTKEDIYRTTEEFKDPTNQKIYSHELSINKIEYQLNAISVIKDLKDSIKGLLKTQTDIIDIKKKANVVVAQLEVVTAKYDEVSKVLTNNSKETLKVISDEQKARKSDSEKVEAHIKAIESSIDTNQKLFNKSLNELENIRQEDLVKVATTLKLEIENENNSLLHSLYKANQKMDSSNSIPTVPEANIVISWLPTPEEFILPIEEARLACLSNALLESMKEDSAKPYNESIAECKKLQAIESEVKTRVTQCINKLAQIAEFPEYKAMVT
jgi:hypothetical protein